MVGRLHRYGRASGAAALALALAGLAGCSSAAPSTPIVADGGASAPTTTCADGDPDRERYGTDCLCCHTGQFSVAGSVSPAVARVVVTDATGNRFDIAVNPYGNFFRHTPLVAPLRASLVFTDGGTREMRGDAPSGACNGCHGAPAGAPRATARIGE